MATIKITIKKGSRAEKAIKNYMEEKKAFIKAVSTGNAIEYANQRPVKFATPV